MKIRKECPKKGNKYYNNKSHGGLSDAVNGYPMISGLTVLDNCVGWANSRFNEILNDPSLEGVVKKFRYQLVCDAEDFIESAKRQSLKISPTPIEGGIMVWRKGATLSSSDGAGHVAVVERVYEDGTILTSESGWASWTFKTVRRDNTNGRWGQNSLYTFRGCIINPGVKDPKVVPVPPLVIDGIGGTCTARAMQRFFGTLQDGVISGQHRALNKYYPALTAVEYGKGGSPCVKKLQKWVGTTQDGVLGEETVKAWQKKLGVEVDGIFGAKSMKAWQKYLNEHKLATYPTPSKGRKSYKVIDVSEFQGTIDWTKVKADGVVGAIIRYGDGTYKDPYFTKNITGAKKAGLHVGAYIFSRAKTKSEAEKEATSLYNGSKSYDPDMPLYIDLEAKGLEEYANVVAQAFLVKMKALGGRGGVYANLNWWNNYLADTAKNYSSNPFWIAQYNDTMDYKPASDMGMWQYTSSGSVDGINGNVDRDKCYVAYWESAEPTWVEKANKWAEDLADDPKAGYRKWSSEDESTHKCLICHPESDPKHKWYKKTWNCIGESLAYLHHGGGIPCKCGCGVLNNAFMTKLLTMNKDEALKELKEKLGINDIALIRNGGKTIPQTKMKAGDLCITYDSKGEATHIYPYIGNGKMIDCGNWSNKAKQIAERDASPCKVIIRYTGK